jgi:hypothetical protein
MVQMTEQQPKTPQIIDIVEMPPTQNGSQTPDTARIEDIMQMAAQMVDIQPLIVTNTSFPIWYRHSTGSFSMTLVSKSSMTSDMS